MKAKDIMEPLKAYLAPDDTLKSAVNKMKVCGRGEGLVGVKWMVVLDADGSLMGVVSIKDILGAVIPSYLKVTKLGGFTWDGMLEEMARKVADKKVSEFMTPNVISVPERAPLMECADLLIKHNLQRLPVLSEQKKVVGMIYIRDLYYAIVKVLFEGEEICPL